MFSYFLDSIPRTISAGSNSNAKRVCFDRLVETTPDVLFRYRCTPQPGLEYANQTIESISGYPISSFYSDPNLIFRIIHPQDRARVKADMLDSSTGMLLHIRWLHANGSTLQMEQLIIPVYDETGKLVALEGVARQQKPSIPTPIHIPNLSDYRQRLLEISRRMAENFTAEDVLVHIFQTLEDSLHFNECRIVVHSNQEKLSSLLGMVILRLQTETVQLRVSPSRSDVTTGILRLPGEDTSQPMEEMSLRLRLGEEVFGSIHITRKAEQPFGDKELDLAHLCVFYAALAIENAGLIGDRKSQVEAIQNYLPSQDDLEHPFSLEEVGESIGRKALDVSRLDAVAVMSVSPMGALKILYSSGVSAAYLAHLSINQVSMIEGGPLDRPEMLLIPDIQDLAEDSLPRLLGDAEGFRSMAVCPLLSRGAVVATINCYGARPHVWMPEQNKALRIFTRQAGFVYANTRLYCDLEETYTQTVQTLARAIGAHDSYTSRHSSRLAEWAEAIARRMNCSADEVRVIRWAAQLHDIGKIGVPDSILSKASPLTDEEWDVIRRHPLMGAEIVAPFKKLEEITPMIRWHQEKFDGTGYPDGLRGEQIPLGARILTVVDAFGAMTDERAYRKALSDVEAVQELQRCSGTHFDSRIVQEFLEVINAMPVHCH